MVPGTSEAALMKPGLQLWPWTLVLGESSLQEGLWLPDITWRQRPHGADSVGGARCSPLWQDIRHRVKPFLPPDHPSFKGQRSTP